MEKKLETSETTDMIEPLFPNIKQVPHRVMKRRKHDRAAAPGSEAERSIRMKDKIYTESRLTGEKASDIARRYFARTPERLCA
jgi:hypothetical protein